MINYSEYFNSLEKHQPWVGLGLGLSKPYTAPTAAPSGSLFLLVDGTSNLLLVNGTDKLLIVG